MGGAHLLHGLAYSESFGPGSRTESVVDSDSMDWYVFIAVVVTEEMSEGH